MLRLLAWQLLRGSQTPLRDVDRAAREAELDARDRGLLRKLISTELRRRGTLRAVVRAYASGRPSTDLSAHLHLGLVQLLFLDQVPDHAAVSETVGAVHRSLGPSKVKYVNAVLRAVARDRTRGVSGDPRRDLVGRDLHLAQEIFRDPVEHPLLWAEDALSMPAPLYKRWRKHHGEERAEELARLALEEPTLSVRWTDEAARAELEELGARPGRHANVVLLPPGSTSAIVGSAAFREGRATIQGETALRAAELVEAQAGERILDLCAAPGGKTAVLAASGASILACDIDPARLERVRDGVERMGFAEHVELRASDGTRAVDESDFDAVLIDAPCSNTGVLAARPAARWRFGPETQRSLKTLQDRLLDEGAAKVRIGGRLVYSTCSLENDENAQRVQAFLERTSGFRLDSEQGFLPAREEGPVDGGWSARLVRDA